MGSQVPRKSRRVGIHRQRRRRDQRKVVIGWSLEAKQKPLHRTPWLIPKEEAL